MNYRGIRFYLILIIFGAYFCMPDLLIATCVLLIGLSVLWAFIFITWKRQKEELKSTESEHAEWQNGQTIESDFSTFENEIDDNSKQYPPNSSVQIKEPNSIDECFSLFRINLDASENDLDKAYRELIKKYHPDLVANLGIEFQQLAEQKSKIINIAYRRLKEFIKDNAEVTWNI